MGGPLDTAGWLACLLVRLGHPRGRSLTRCSERQLLQRNFLYPSALGASCTWFEGGRAGGGGVCGGKRKMMPVRSRLCGVSRRFGVAYCMYVLCFSARLAFSLFPNTPCVPRLPTLHTPCVD